MGIETDPDLGGSGSSFTSAIIAIEELAKIDPSVSVMCDVHNTLVNTIFRTYATKEQQERFLPQLSESKVCLSRQLIPLPSVYSISFSPLFVLPQIGSFCLSEPASGSDAFALQTRATPSEDGSYYTITGSKMWITNAAEAEIFLVFATVDPSKGYKGITCFVVPRELGVEIAKKEQKLGIRASSTCVLNFDGVKVPAENLIGGPEQLGKGYKARV